MTRDADTELNSEIFQHISNISAAMVGVCLTAIGLIRVIVAVRHKNTFADNLLSADAVIFLIATLSSYWTLRKHHRRRQPAIEALADLSFMAGMSLMVFICLFITYAIATD